jgi:hypothetical protein
MQHIQNKRDNHKLLFLFLFLFLFLYLVLFLLGAETSHKIKDKRRSTQVIRQREIRGEKIKKIKVPWRAVSTSAHQQEA